MCSVSPPYYEYLNTSAGQNFKIFNLAPTFGQRINENLRDSLYNSFQLVYTGTEKTHHWNRQSFLTNWQLYDKKCLHIAKLSPSSIPKNWSEIISLSQFPQHWLIRPNNFFYWFFWPENYLGWKFNSEKIFRLKNF